MIRTARYGFLLVPLLLWGCGTGGVQSVTDKAKLAKTRAQLEDALGPPTRSQTYTRGGKTFAEWTYEAKDGEVTYTLEDDTVIASSEIKKEKKDSKGGTEQK